MDQDTAAEVDVDSHDIGHSSASEFSLKGLVADETYDALKKTFLPHGQGRPPDPPKVTLTNHLLLQLELAKIEGHRTSKAVALWFERLFPEVSYPSSRLASMMDRLLKKVKSLHEKKDDLQAFLHTLLDLDFVSVSLQKLGLRRGQLLEERADTTPVGAAETRTVTNEVIIDLEKFRVREKQRDIFTSKWIKAISGCKDSDKTFVPHVKNIMSCYHKLAHKKDGVHGEKLANFLATQFTLPQPVSKGIPPKAPASLSKEEKLIKQLSRENNKLLERIADMKKEIFVLNSTVQDLSREKMNLLSEANQNCRLRKEVKQLQLRVNQQKQTIRDLQPRNMQKRRKRLNCLRTEVRNLRRKSSRLMKTSE